MLIFHYTDLPGFNAITAAPDWVFRASQPRGNHPFGAYFTTYGPDRPLYKIGIPLEKRTHLFCFNDADDLKPIRGGRGRYILFSVSDYHVPKVRQVFSGLANDYSERSS